jgi:protein subunit release factor B
VAPLNLNELTDVTPAKRDALRERLARLGVDPARIDESFSRGGGKGGQKVNKTSNRVTLRYAPLDLTVHCQRERRRSLNRFLALRELADRVEMKVSPATSARLMEFDRLRKQKDRLRRRNAPPPPAPPDRT